MTDEIRELKEQLHTAQQVILTLQNNRAQLLDIRELVLDLESEAMANIETSVLISSPLLSARHRADGQKLMAVVNRFKAILYPKDMETPSE